MIRLMARRREGFARGVFGRSIDGTHFFGGVGQGKLRSIDDGPCAKFLTRIGWLSVHTISFSHLSPMADIPYVAMFGLVKGEGPDQPGYVHMKEALGTDFIDRGIMRRVDKYVGRRKRTKRAQPPNDYPNAMHHLPSYLGDTPTPHQQEELAEEGTSLFQPIDQWYLECQKMSTPSDGDRDAAVPDSEVKWGRKVSKKSLKMQSCPNLRELIIEELNEECYFTTIRVSLEKMLLGSRWVLKDDAARSRLYLNSGWHAIVIKRCVSNKPQNVADVYIVPPCGEEMRLRSKREVVAFLNEKASVQLVSKMHPFCLMDKTNAFPFSVKAMAHHDATILQWASTEPTRAAKGPAEEEEGGGSEASGEGGKRHGKDTMVYANGDKYEGDWKEDKRHGKGTFVYANGDKWEGDWKNGARRGKGTFVYANGAKYEGDSVNGKRYKKDTSISSLSATPEAEAEDEDDDIYNCGICCNSLFGAKIVMCRQGHNLCEMCANKLKNTSSNGHNRKIPQCPTCNVAMKRKFDDPWGRNLYAERLLSLEHKKRRKNPSSVTASK